MITSDEIKAILAKNEVIISKDDPVLSFLAVHQVLLDEYSKVIESSVETATQKLTENLKTIQIEVSKNLENQTEHFSERSKKLANEIVGQAVNEFSLAEDKLTKQIREIKLTDKQNPYDKKFKNLEIWLICNSFLIAACLFISFLGIII